MEFARKLCFLPFAIIISLTFWGCRKRINQAASAKNYDRIPHENMSKIPINPIIKANVGIQFKVEPERLKFSDIGSVKIKLTNFTATTITTGTTYYIEFYNLSYWKRLEHLDSVVFDDLMFKIAPSSSKELIINLLLVPHKYDRGKYRIQKEVVCSGKKSIVSAEFTVE